MINATTPLAQSDKDRLTRLATYASVGTALLIILTKAIGWALTDSLALLASLVDSILDVVVSIINLVAVRYALQPPDKEHRFGHGKAEDLAAFTQSAFIAFSALLIAAEAIKRFSAPQLPEHNSIGIGILLFSTIVTTALVFFQRHVVRMTNSSVVAADSLHYFSDILVNIAVITALAVTSIYQKSWIDPVFAIGVALYMIYGAWQIVQGAFNNLMDHEFDESDKEVIYAIINKHPEVLGVHEMKTRQSGNKPFIQFHLEMDGNISLYIAHRISDEIERSVIEKFPNAEVFIHQDPR